MEMVLSNLEKDEKLGGNLKKALKLTFSVPPWNNKQNVTVALAIFHGTTTAAMKSYFPDLLDAANFLSLFHKLFFCNSKNQFNSSDRLGNATVLDDSKPEFFSHLADWIESWFECPYAYKANIPCANHYIRGIELIRK